MKDQVVLDLGRAVPAAVADALPKVTGLRIRADGLHAGLRVDGRRWRLLVRPRWPDDSGTGRVARAFAEEARLAGDDVLPFVADEILPIRVRQELEDLGISYADGGGALHVVAPGVLVHVEHPREPRRKATQGGRGLGTATVRAVQVLLAEPAREWTVTELAEVADLSLGQSHNLWSLLQHAGLAVTRGAGRGTRRAVRDPRRLLDWLAVQRPARRVHEQLACALYANTLPRLCAKVTQALDGAAVPHAWTGAAAAALQQAGPTAVPRAMVRVEPERELHEVAELLGAQPTDRGANLVLCRDVGHVGIHSAVRQPAADAEVPLAPPVRVYLDLLGERRGEDTAAHYREVVLGY